jgi:hypothetical protein
MDMPSNVMRYDAMVRAIAECHAVDEVKDLRDKAMALEIYQRQAQNLEAERKACEVRLRAERRCGEILNAMRESGAMAKPNPGKVNQFTSEVRSHAATEPQKTLSDLGISKTQSSRWQALDRVPEHEFENALRDPGTKPTTTGILARTEPEHRISSEALFIWGRLRDLEREGYFDKSAGYLMSTMTDAMRADVQRLIPLLSEWAQTLEEEISYEPA